ncbi:MAG: L,D-transpeptidase [Acidobacteria bacterium]|nr:L,D-transpeptidase [Acidobacteriota bacterium]
MKSIVLFLTVILFAAFLGMCDSFNKREDKVVKQEPRLEILPLQQERGQWKILASDTPTISVVAPGATLARILDQPEGSEEQIELKMITTPKHTATGTFSTELNLPSDFAGLVWAETFYSDGTTKETTPVAVAVETASETTAQPFNVIGGSVGTDESARSDKFTGGKIERTLLKPGDRNIRITVNVPAFQLTLWQNGKEVRAYNIGIGRKGFPIPIGERETRSIIFNPQWIPPDSEWVRRTTGPEPYERVGPEDSRNPIGKIKIPLGGGYLIDEAATPSDIGHLVSHGCVRMLGDDLFDLTEKIIAAFELPVSPQQLSHVKQSSDRLAVTFESPLLVDINYDSQVVEGGILHLFPDVYDRGAFSVESLRAELLSSGIEAAKLEEPILRQLIERVSPGKQLVIRVRDIEAGRLGIGQIQPVVKSLGQEQLMARRIGQ